MMDGRRVELSLTLLSAAADQAAESSDVSVVSRRPKRKQTWDEAAVTSAAIMSNHQSLSSSSTATASVDLQLHDPLPLDWEQCLDLQSGRMYYMNRKTLKKSWNQPKEQKLDLELNIYPPDHQHNKLLTNPNNPTSPAAEDQPTKQRPPSSSNASSSPGGGGSSSSSSNMVAVVCINCHLLVMLCRSSPSCPNCKHMNSLFLPAAASASPVPPPPAAAAEPPKTLSLLH